MRIGALEVEDKYHRTTEDERDDAATRGRSSLRSGAEILPAGRRPTRSSAPPQAGWGLAARGWARPSSTCRCGRASCGHAAVRRSARPQPLLSRRLAASRPRRSAGHGLPACIFCSACVWMEPGGATGVRCDEMRV